MMIIPGSFSKEVHGGTGLPDRPTLISSNIKNTQEGELFGVARLSLRMIVTA